MTEVFVKKVLFPKSSDFTRSGRSPFFVERLVEKLDFGVFSSVLEKIPIQIADARFLGNSYRFLAGAPDLTLESLDQIHEKRVRLDVQSSAV